jgi:2-polyprenyl-6-methoxyphenol hydroxylase-like FAD-dependent oxidoreductase
METIAANGNSGSNQAQSPAIAILGAGPSGLAFARLMRLNHITYTIFERDESSSTVGQGGTLDVHAETGQQTLKEAGLLEQFRAKARYDAQRMVIVDRNAKLAVDLDGRDSESRPEIDRKDLRQLLLDAIPSETIQWSSRVLSVSRKDSNGKMSVQLEDGSTHAGFSLVVGADGAWSKARPLVNDAGLGRLHVC